MMRMYNASFTAFYNVNRPRRKKALKPLKKQAREANKKDIINEREIVEAIEQEEGKSWVNKIYQANGLKKGGK